MSFLSDPVTQGYLEASMRLAMPIMLAALGGIFAERSGVLNIALEGMMLAGSFTGFVAAYTTGNLWLGVVAGMLAGTAVGAVLMLYAVLIGSNQVVVGVAINLLIVGVTSFLYRSVFGVGTATPRVSSFAPVDLAWLSNLPLVGPLLFHQAPIVYVGLILVPVVWIVMTKTAFGWQVTAAGEHPEALETLGISVTRTRFICLLMSGLLAGLGGAFLSLSATGIFIDNMTAGRGYIALAILVLGRRHPLGVLLAAMLFGAADALQLRGQTLGIALPYQAFLTLPYILTILVLVLFAGKARNPAALGIPFRRASSE
ncbi:ABC transporter permease [Agrobacterium vitis]|uniref:ABC transporter permease n=1 Tax=Agrobacterium vitis TaxID=373 RepID=UPI001573685E|nr:ABC transporter permease [Agrobacterium vitis]NSZ20024.1 ABC transporter permease [Agrobacterium vitis]QZO07520.1 ABC transporter permease [Agrobacterium vitis]UJL90714.1 ABC transporter permease [Agrobacterium vitis]